MTADLLVRRASSFVLWRVADSAPPPRLVIGQLQPGAPVTFAGEQQFDLQQVVGFPDLLEIPAANCNLVDGQVYHYWFDVLDAHPDRPGQRIRVTDPLAFTVDWRLRAPQPAGPGYTDDDRYPAAVVKFSQGKLIPCDAGGETGELQTDPPLAALPPNNRVVI